MKNTNAGKLIKNQIVKTATDIYLLRYRLIKSLHKNESLFGSEVQTTSTIFCLSIKNTIV